MPKRVLMVCPNGEFGGAERTALNFATALRARGNWAPSVALLRPGQMEAELRAHGIPHQVLPFFRLSRPGTWIPTIRALIALARAEGAALVHSEMAYGHIVGGSAALAARLPSLWYQHGPVNPFSLQQRLASAIPASGFLTNSRATLARQPMLLFPAQQAVIPPPIAPEFLGRARDESARARFGIAIHERVALLPGRFQARFKGQDLALAAYAPLVREFPASRFVLLGAPTNSGHRDFADCERLRETAARINAEAGREAVLLLPFDRDIIPYLDMADFVVNASLIPEPFGCTLVEALARGRFVITGDAGGARDIAQGTEAALLYKLGDEAALRAELARAFRALDDGVDAKAARERAARTRAHAYLADGLAARLENFYDEITGA